MSTKISRIPCTNITGSSFWVLISLLLILFMCNIHGNPVNSGITDSSAEVQKADCSDTPKINVVSYWRKGFTPIHQLDSELIPEKIEKYIQAPSVAHVGIECLSTSPIEWIFEGVDNPSAKVTDAVRKFGGEYVEPCFISVLMVKTNKLATGRYRCQTINQTLSSELYVYGEEIPVTPQTEFHSSLHPRSNFLQNVTSRFFCNPIRLWMGKANSIPILLNDGQTLNIVSNDSSSIILPCQVVNPSIQPYLYKGNSKVNITGSVPFNPEVGFILDSKNMSDPFDTYKCKVTDDIVTINVAKPAALEVSPSEKKVLVVRNHSVRLTCRSQNPIGFEIDGLPVASNNDAPGSGFEYRHSYVFLGTETSKVSCVDLSAKKPHHTWNCLVISEEIDASAGIFYDSTTNRFVCRSRTGEKPAMAVLNCTNPTNCKFMEKCFKMDAPYTVVGSRYRGPRDDYCNAIARGNPCDKSDQIGLNSTLTACTYVNANNGFNSGLVYCSFDGGPDQTLQFFRGVDRNATVITSWSDASPNQLIQIETPNRTVYVGEFVKFTCRTVKYIFTRGFTWMFLMNNGTYKTATAESIPDSTRRYWREPVNAESVNLKIDDPDIVGVVCLVPFWNTTDWFNSSHVLDVEIGTSPRILNNQDEANIEVTSGFNQSIFCTIQGNPKPTVRWFKNEQEIIDQQSEETVNPLTNSFTSWLHLGIVDQDDDAEYTCVAINVFANASYKFQLNVAQNSARDIFLLIIGIIFFMCFASIVLILSRKLFKRDKLIKKLMSDKDIHKFHEGDKESLLKASDGYIRGEYLRYDRGYEIAAEDLCIEGEVLGKGEFGVVHKGRLRRNSEDKGFEVAVKTTRGSDTAHFKALLSELKILTYIGWHGHDNIISLHGAVTRNLKYHDVYVVVEYCHLGNLKDFLQSNKSTYLNQINDDKIDLKLTMNISQVNSSGYVNKNYTMSTGDLLNWCQQVASGMEYLEVKKIVHGDLAARNILLTGDRTAKITDFGLSIRLDNDYNNEMSNSQNALPWKWLAPETLEDNKFSPQSDVWAFGITLWEIFSMGEPPYPGLVCNIDFRNRILQGYRMEKPEFANSELYSKMWQCWMISPSERIKFADLRRFFHRILHNSIYPELPTVLTNAEGTVEYLDPSTLHHLST